MDDRKALAWMVVDANGRRSIFVDEARADAAAVTQHGIKTSMLRAEPGERAEAWLIVGPRGMRYVVLRADRAQQMAADFHGTAVGLVPATPLPVVDPEGAR